ncbi:endodeoxyribonuclease [Podila minutissima]|uniref:DNA topoisomerase (ATP-hydrolyzing) n=1 Tax=Podila minutissima TaxID=64525 RepID=A0A9P5SLC1_9FUNG|nr:endodeoxyribonuclease [Podila minutissima]
MLGNGSLHQPDLPGDTLASSDLDNNHENDWSMPMFDSDPDCMEEVYQGTVPQTVFDYTNTELDCSLDQGLTGSVDMHTPALSSDISVEEHDHSRKKLKISHYLQEEIPIPAPSFTPVPSPPSPLSPPSPPSSSSSLCQKLLEDRQVHFSRTVPRSREWLMEQQEGMLTDLLFTVCEGEPKLTLAARMNQYCIVYDQKHGVIRRKADVVRSGKSKDPSRKTISFKKKSWQVAASIIRAVDLVHNNLSQDVVSTKRDIFYRDIPTFRRQARVDAIVEDLACTFQTPRSCLNVVAASRSVVYGSVRFTFKVSRHTLESMDVEGLEARASSDRISHASGRGGGISYTDFNTLVSVPVIESEVMRIEIHPETKYVLVIEKEATLSHLISIGFCESHGPCILLTSKGYPDKVSRRLLKRISDMVQDGVYFLDRPFELNLALLKSPCSSSAPLHIPLLAVVDCDPNGIDIYLTYRCGSVRSAYDNENLAISTLQLLGQLPSDWTMFFRGCSLADLSGGQEQGGKDSKQKKYLQDQLSRSLLPLTRRDRSLLLKRLTQHPFVKADKTIKAEISRMLHMNCKSELQSLYMSIDYGGDSCDSGSTYCDVASELEAGEGSEDPWAKHHAWRQHALFTRSARIRTMFPGLGIASVAFAAYLGYEYVTAPKDAHHGEGHH